MKFKERTLDALADMIVGNGDPSTTPFPYRSTAPGVRPAWALLMSQIAMRRRARRYRRWIAKRRLG